MAKVNDFNVIVIGGGPGGEASAYYSAKNGLKTALIEQKYPGGEMLTEGYFSIKALLTDEKLTNENLIRKQKQGGNAWFKNLTNVGVQVYQGEAAIKDEGTIEIVSKDQIELLSSDYIVIATGTYPLSPLQNVAIDEENIISHRGAIYLNPVNVNHIAILGGDVEGCEFASYFNDQGINVTIVEQMDRLLPNADDDTSKYLTQEFLAKGICVNTNSKVFNVNNSQNKLSIACQVNNEKRSITADKILMTGKRFPLFPKQINRLKLDYTNDGLIKVNNKMETSNNRVFAVGDVIGGIPSANAAKKEGETAIMNILGYHKNMDYSSTPFVFYCSPEVSGIGYREIDLIKKDIPYQLGISYFSDNWRAISLGYRRGFIKTLIDPQTNQLLGVHMTGDNISELMGLPTLAMKEQFPVDRIVDLALPHPTMGELLIDSLVKGLD